MSDPPPRRFSNRAEPPNDDLRAEVAEKQPSRHSQLPSDGPSAAPSDRSARRLRRKDKEVIDCWLRERPKGRGRAGSERRGNGARDSSKHERQSDRGVLTSERRPSESSRSRSHADGKRPVGRVPTRDGTAGSRENRQQRRDSGISRFNTDASLDWSVTVRGGLREENEDWDAIVPQRCSTDLKNIYIAVMGVTGSGKSSFIQLLTGEDVMIEDGLESCTREVRQYAFTHENRLRVHLIDTPGFDDTSGSDSQVLGDIACWLTDTYKHQIRLSGIIYLHRISDPKMQGSARRNLNMFQKLCGMDCMRRIVLVTTYWDVVDPREGEKRERQLRETDEFWGYMIKGGSIVRRHLGKENRRSALRIIGELVNHQEEIVLEIQTEMADRRLGLDETQVGRQLNNDILEEQRRDAETIEELKKDLSEALAEKDRGLAHQLNEQRRRLEGRIREGERARERLRNDFEARLRERDEEFQRLQAEHEDLRRDFALERERAEDLRLALQQERAEYEERLRWEREDAAELEARNRRLEFLLRRKEAELRKVEQSMARIGRKVKARTSRLYNLCLYFRT